MTLWNTVRRLALGLGLAAAGATSAAAEVDLQGKTVTIMIGYGVGGSYHFYATLFAHHLGKYLPGQPNIIVQSNPGAGGVRMLNEAAVRMRGDGSALFIPPDTMVVTQLLQPEGLAYDSRKFRYLGTADQENTFWVMRRGAKDTVELMRQAETFMGSSGKGSTGYMIPALTGPLLGLKIKQVGGYTSSREMLLAMEKGEIDGTLQAWQVWKQSRPTWFEPNGFAVPVIQIGAIADPDAPPTPLLRDLVTAENRPLASLFDTIGVLGRSLAAPPSASPETVAVLRKAFQSMLADADFIAEAKQTQIRILPRTGEELEASMAAAFSDLNPEVLKRAQAMTQ